MTEPTIAVSGNAAHGFIVEMFDGERFHTFMPPAGTTDVGAARDWASEAWAKQYPAAAHKPEAERQIGADTDVTGAKEAKSAIQNALAEHAAKLGEGHDAHTSAGTDA